MNYTEVKRDLEEMHRRIMVILERHWNHGSDASDANWNMALLLALREPWKWSQIAERHDWLLYTNEKLWILRVKSSRTADSGFVRQLFHATKSDDGSVEWAYVGNFSDNHKAGQFIRQQFPPKANWGS